jgi:hypothetical protein
MSSPASPSVLGQPPAAPAAPAAAARAGLDRPLVPALAALAGAAAFVLARLRLAAAGNITEFVRAAAPFTSRGQAPPGLAVFPSNGYDGQFYYRLALDPADLHRTAFGITMDTPFRLQRIGYPVLAWALSLGRQAWVPPALVLVNVLAVGAIGLAGGLLARDSGRHACWGLLFAGYFGFFMSLGNDLTEPVAAAGLLGGVLAVRRGRPLLAGLLFGYAALTRETAIVVPLALGLARLATVSGRRDRPGRAEAAWLLPVVLFTAWQVVLRAATGSIVLFTSADSNTSTGLPFGALASALRMNVGLLWPPTGAAYIWFGELATLAAFVTVALAGGWIAAGLAYERIALLFFVLELGLLAPSIWSGHADLRSLDEVYLFAVLLVLGAARRPRLGVLAGLAALAVVVAAAHQALYLS